MKMDHKRNKHSNRIKKFSDYIMSFAFLYSSLLCFTEAAEKWENQKVVSIIILTCGIFSFIAVFRLKISEIYYNLKNKKE